MMQNYIDFVRGKSQLDGRFGFKPVFEHPSAFDFQTAMVAFAVEQVRSAMFEDCGLGKSLQEMIWAENVVRYKNKPVLHLSPLMVSMQMVDEADKFSFDAQRSRDGKFKPGARQVFTNYENLHKFDPNDFAGVSCDESSIIKNFDGARKSEITEFMRRVEFRLLASATPSPNDYIELGTSSEALGHLGYMDMLGQFFKNDEDSLHPAFIGSKWRFKYHAERDFWRWVCSWARAIRKPSDLGFDDAGFSLPALIEREHVLESPVLTGNLFAMPTTSLLEERQERRDTIEIRCAKAAEVLAGAESSVAWCHLNAEAEALVRMIPGAVEIKGADDDDKRAEVLNAFRLGQISNIVTKPKIAALGLNWQHAHRATYFADHSFEQYYQAVRRMWRFGQQHPVEIDVITTQSLAGVTKNLRRKAVAAEEMFTVMIEQMNDALGLKRFREHPNEVSLPAWL